MTVSSVMTRAGMHQLISAAKMTMMITSIPRDFRPLLFMMVITDSHQRVFKRHSKPHNRHLKQLYCSTLLQPGTFQDHNQTTSSLTTKLWRRSKVISGQEQHTGRKSSLSVILGRPMRPTWNLPRQPKGAKPKPLKHPQQAPLL